MKCPACGSKLEKVGNLLYCKNCNTVVCPECHSTMIYDPNASGFVCPNCGNFVFAEPVSSKHNKFETSETSSKKHRHEERMLSCPNCGFKASIENFIHEKEGIICPRCGTVVLDNFIEDIEWREYEPEDRLNRRGGEPLIRNVSTTYVGGEIINRGRDVRASDARVMDDYLASLAYKVGKDAWLEPHIIDFVVFVFPRLLKDRKFVRDVPYAEQSSVLLALYAYAMYGVNVNMKKLQLLADKLNIEYTRKTLVDAKRIIRLLPKYLKNLGVRL